MDKDDPRRRRNRVNQMRRAKCQVLMALEGLDPIDKLVALQDAINDALEARRVAQLAERGL